MPAEVVCWIALAAIVVVDVWALALFLRGWRSTRRAPDAPPDAADDFTWVFLVPALDEELTIRDSVERLLAVPVARRTIVVVDDGSDDRTPEILAELAHPDLVVVRRGPPDARKGKAAALNHAYRALEQVLPEGDRRDVIVAVVDADGRLDPDAPRYAAAHFRDPSVGGVQTLVRIYNRQRLLTWCQDVEFGVYGHLYQAGRNDWGTAGMGGNGQFNRLSALDDVAGPDGPWRDRLTEDQDLGLRLLVRGWRARQELRASVHQQGPPTVRALFRQRTRWAQGNLQAMSLAPALMRAPVPLGARAELLLYLFMPIWQGLVGIAFITAVVLAAVGVSPFWANGPTWQLALFYVLAFAGTVLGCLAARRGDGPRGWVMGFLTGHVYALYTWFIWPVLARSALRQLRGRRDWTKTEREPIARSASPAPG